MRQLLQNATFITNCDSTRSNKTLNDERITLVENNKVVSHESELVEIFSKYFTHIVQKLGIDAQNHPSIKVIRENIDFANNFSFDLINLEYKSKIK